MASPTDRCPDSTAGTAGSSESATDLIARTSRSSISLFTSSGVQAASVVAREQDASPDPGDREHLERPGAGLDAIGAEACADRDVRDFERPEYLQRGRLAHDVGRVVVADQQEGCDSLCREPGNAPGELALVGLGGIAALVGVAAEQHEVDAVVDGEVDGLVEGVEEVHEPGRQAGVGVDPAVVLDPYVYVGKVQDAHGLCVNRTPVLNRRRRLQLVGHGVNLEAQGLQGGIAHQRLLALFTGRDKHRPADASDLHVGQRERRLIVRPSPISTSAS